MDSQMKDMEKRIYCKIDDLKKPVELMYNKMFVDNGNPCLQTKIDRNSRWISAVTWVFGVIYAASVGVIAWFFKN